MENLPDDLNIEIDHSKRDKQKNRRQKVICELLLDFAKNTTLHGLRYITERGVSVVEKIFWIVTFVTSLSLCILLIEKVWVKWQASPVIVSLSEQLVPVTEVPFPAVTICPQAKIRQEAYNYTEHKINLSIFRNEVLSNIPFTSHEKAIKDFIEKNPLLDDLRGIDLICRRYYEFYNIPMSFVDYTAVESIRKIAPQLHDVLNFGTWRSKVFKAEHHAFHPVLTQEGVCFTFNNLHYQEIFHMDRIQTNYKYMESYFRQKGWSLQDGYSNSSYKTYPFRGRANGAEADLIVYLKDVLDRDILCDGVNSGFKVYLHHPADLPQSSLYYYAVLPDQVASFAIKVNVMSTSDALANYPPHIRQCYFPGEKDLWYFKVYTPNNCFLECLTNYTLEVCGCVWYHMPHNGEVDLCSIDMMMCVFDALEDYSTAEGINNNNQSFCQCMPLCNSVQYEAEVLKTNYNTNAYKNAINQAKAIINNQSQAEEDTEEIYDSTESNIKIEMYFKEPRFVSMRRSELFGLTDFLANCGGLLGLFLGFSFLSIVEIFYFFTLRLACTLRKDNIAEKESKAKGIKDTVEKY